MLRYCISRLTQTVIVLTGTSLILFCILYKLPGDPAKLLAGPKASPRAVENVKHKLALDRPIYVQYATYAANVFQGNLGTSYRYGRPVGAILTEALPATAKLALFAVLIEVLLGMIAGAVSALRKRSFLDSFITVSTTFLMCIPVFWLGMVMQYFFSLELRWFPVSGYSPYDISYLILPAIAIAAVSSAVLIRLVRASMVEASSAPYLTFARARGLSERRVILRHQLPNALLPAVSFIGMEAGTLMTGAVATEIVFNYPGIGLAVYQAVLQRDMPVVVGGVMIMVLICIFFNLLADITYGLLNPRIRLGEND